MTKFPFEMRRLSRSSKHLSTDHTMHDSSDQLDLTFEYPCEKMDTAEKRLTSRFGFAPQQSDVSIDSVFDNITTTKPSRSPSPQQWGLNKDALDALSTSPSHHGRHNSTSSVSSRRKSRTRSIFGLDNDGRRGSLPHMMCNAAASGDTAQIGRLIGAGADPKKKSKDGLSPVHLAAAGGHLAVLKSLVMHGAKLDITDSEGHTPLHAAVLAGQTDVVPFLVASGAPIDAMDKMGCTAMDYAKRQAEEQTEDSTENMEMGNKIRFSYVFQQPATDKKAKRASIGSTMTTTRRRPSIQEILRNCAEGEGKMF